MDINHNIFITISAALFVISTFVVMHAIKSYVGIGIKEGLQLNKKSIQVSVNKVVKQET